MTTDHLYLQVKFYFYYHLRHSRELSCRAVHRARRDPKLTVAKFCNCPNTSQTDGSGTNMNTRISIQVVSPGCVKQEIPFVEDPEVCSMDFGRESFISIEVCRDRTLALSPSCKKND